MCLRCQYAADYNIAFAVRALDACAIWVVAFSLRVPCSLVGWWASGLPLPRHTLPCSRSPPSAAMDVDTTFGESEGASPAPPALAWARPREVPRGATG